MQICSTWNWWQSYNKLICYRKWKIINWKLMEHSCTKIEFMHLIPRNWELWSWGNCIMCLMLVTRDIRKQWKQSRAITFGQVWRRKLQNTLPDVWSVRRSRMSIGTQLGCYNHCPFLSGSGKWWERISSPNCPEQASNMMLSWWRWTSLLKLSISFLRRLLTRKPMLLIFIWGK